MNAQAAGRRQGGLYAVYAASAVIVCGIAAGLHLTVPEVVGDYVTNGLTFPVFRYGLLLSLIACGIALSGGRHPLAVAANLAILAAATWFGLHQAEAIVLEYEALAELIGGYPVVAATMSVAAGSALLLPPSARKWFLPVLSVICGVGLGLTVILYSPLDYFAEWFFWAGGTGGLAVVLASIVLADGVWKNFAGSWLTIAERILGSWLIAASLMLTALAFLTPLPLEDESLPPETPEETDSLQPSSCNRWFPQDCGGSFGMPPPSHFRTAMTPAATTSAIPATDTASGISAKNSSPQITAKPT